MTARTTRGREIDTDPRAQLDALMDQCEEPLHRFLYSILGSREAAQDCAQDAFLRAYEQLRRGRSVNAGFVYRVGYNRAMDEFRRRRKERADETSLAHARATDLIGGIAIHQAWEQLTLQDRSLLVLVAIEGMSAPQIAEILGISLNATYMRVSRARARLHDLLGDDDEGP